MCPLFPLLINHTFESLIAKGKSNFSLILVEFYSLGIESLVMFDYFKFNIWSCFYFLCYLLVLVFCLLKFGDVN